MFEALTEAIGVDEAETLMAHLPPSGWSGIATRGDLEHTVALLRSDVAQVRADIAALHSGRDPGERRDSASRRVGASNVSVGAGDLEEASRSRLDAVREKAHRENRRFRRWFAVFTVAAHIGFIVQIAIAI